MIQCDCGNKTKRQPCIMCVLESRGKFILKLNLSKMPKTTEALQVMAAELKSRPRDVLAELVQRELQKREEGAA